MSDGKEEVIELRIPRFLSANSIRKNPWIISTFVFVVLSIILVWNGISPSSLSSGTISANQAANNLVAFLSENAGAQVTLSSVTEENGLYKVDVDYQGNTITVYTTKNGKFFIQDLIPLSSSDNGSGSGTGLVSASEDDDAVNGNANAPVTIIEFSDYQCPFCRKFWTETLPQIETQYIKTGKVKLVFRDFPLTNLHPMAEKSAEAAECVREKGGDTAYFKFHDKMFSEENILDSGNPSGAVTQTVTYTADDLKSWASDLGYDISSCLDSGKYASEVQKDESDAAAAGGQGTPYFVIKKTGSDSGVPLSGAQPFSAFKQIIDGELGG